MPKVNLARDKREEETRAVIAAGMARQGVRFYKSLAEIMGMPESTLLYHLKHIREMRLGELWGIMDKLKIPEEDRKKVV